MNFSLPTIGKLSLTFESACRRRNPPRQGTTLRPRSIADPVNFKQMKIKHMLAWLAAGAPSPPGIPPEPCGPIHHSAEQGPRRWRLPTHYYFSGLPLHGKFHSWLAWPLSPNIKLTVLPRGSFIDTKEIKIE